MIKIHDCSNTSLLIGSNILGFFLALVVTESLKPAPTGVGFWSEESLGLGWREYYDC